MSLAELAIESADSVVVARMSGEIDLSNAHALRRELERSVPNGALGLVLDLTEVDYLDSAGIHLVHRVREGLRARNQRLRLVIPAASPVNDTLRLAGLRWIEEVQDTTDAARRSLHQDPGGVCP